MSSNEFSPQTNPAADQLAARIEQNVRQNPGSTVLPEFVTAVNQHPELLQGVQQKLRQDGYHLAEYDRQPITQTDSSQVRRPVRPVETAHPVAPAPIAPVAPQQARTDLPANTPMPTSYPGALFKMGPLSPISSPPEQQVVRQPAPIQPTPEQQVVRQPAPTAQPAPEPQVLRQPAQLQQPLQQQPIQQAQVGQDYRPGAVQRVDLSTVHPHPAETHVAAPHTDKTDTPARRAADEIAKRALELKQNHGPYWKFIHDECYKYYRNERSGTAYIEFQRELNRILIAEHLLHPRTK